MFGVRGFVQCTALMAAAISVQGAWVLNKEDDAFHINRAQDLLTLAQSGLTKDIPDEAFGYYEVRKDAHMFWWMYGMQGDKEARAEAPLVLWLQGGPGASGTGYGNFLEVGPYDPKMQARKSTWASKTNLLFVDQPVGAGWSYVNSEDALVKTEQEIADDLMVFFKDLLQAYPDLQATPMWVFCESYGGKMGTSFANALSDSFDAGDIAVNFKGIALGDSWISPLDYVESYGSYLYVNGQIDAKARHYIEDYARLMGSAMDDGMYEEATDLWGQQQSVILELTGDVDIYDVSKHDISERDNLPQFMNTVVREHLGIIPKNVQWDQGQAKVFTALSGDFMHDVIGGVDRLLKKGYLVTVYNGNFDIICNTVGTLAWMRKLKWEGMDGFYSSQRDIVTDDTGLTIGFRREHKNLKLWQINNAGHMIPSDQPEAALLMLEDIIGASN
eukprot:Clim_evm84s108 gene=Clim_evmTU84s108